MNFIQKLRNLLDFVEDDPAAFGPIATQSFQASRIAGKFKVEGRVQQVEEKSVWEDVPEPCAFSGSARPEKKK
jgi:hypothetical protein